jgi:hypothetical protein
MRALVYMAGVVLTAALTAGRALGQDYRALEGMTVTAKMDMPASQEGVDIRPGSEAPLDLHKVAGRIKQYGVALHTGQSIMITNVVAKPHNVEVYLGGGGYGTFSDALAQASQMTPVSYPAETRREKDLKEQLKYTNDYWERERIRRELYDVDRQRNRDNQKAAQVSAQQVEQQKRAMAGSRFNIRYDGTMPESATSKSAIMAVLSKYVEFERTPGETQAGPIPQSLTAMAQRSRPQDSSVPALRKGLTVLQVEQILGPAAKVEDVSDGALEIDFREYSSDGQHVTTEFVGGVLANYTITSQ